MLLLKPGFLLFLRYLQILLSCYCSSQIGLVQGTLAKSTEQFYPCVTFISLQTKSDWQAVYPYAGLLQKLQPANPPLTLLPVRVSTWWLSGNRYNFVAASPVRDQVIRGKPELPQTTRLTECMNLSWPYLPLKFFYSLRPLPLCQSCSTLLSFTGSTGMKKSRGGC